MIFFLLAFLLTVLLTPAAMMLANKFDIVDHPNGVLKRHYKSTPYLGGIALFISVIATALMLKRTEFLDLKHLGLFLGGLIIVCGGLIDDKRALPPGLKMGVQIAAAICAMYSGLHTNFNAPPGLNSVLTLLWIIGGVNAFNLIDIMDGLAAGVAALSALFLGVLLLLKGEIFYSSLLFALSGACLGFLLFNFNPARIFLGDAGSQFLGYLLFCLAIQWSTNETFGHRLFIPLFILAIPLFETFFVSVMRLRRRVSPFRGSNDHFALRMVKVGLSIKATVGLTLLCSVTLGLAAILILKYDAASYYTIGIALLLVLILFHRLGGIDMTAAREEKA
ncbi:MraY family glycosyltransferase [Paenibacillus sp. sgz500958]|uniref:MraY family glycosyltransferase n=1 Tax=Paenibacillus sp. sgz500958 TaxID=3242475 RepID=UPI0036D2F0FE